MATQRLRLVRPPSSPLPRKSRRPQLQQLQVCLERERALLTRWMVRLRRAFQAAEQQRQRIDRIEQQLKQQEGP